MNKELEKKLVFDTEKKALVNDIESLNRQSDKILIKYKNNPKNYTYRTARLRILENPSEINPEGKIIKHKGILLVRITQILEFKLGSQKFWQITFEDQTQKNYDYASLDVQKNVLTEKNTSIHLNI